VTINKVRRRDRLYIRAHKCLTYATPVSALAELFDAYAVILGNYRLLASILVYVSGIALILYISVSANLQRMYEQVIQQLPVDQGVADQYIASRRLRRRGEILWVIQVFMAGTVSLGMFVSHSPALWLR
jgi:hypothetical protein